MTSQTDVHLGPSESSALPRTAILTTVWLCLRPPDSDGQSLYFETLPYN